jgi:hypothetical protein
MNVGAPRPFWYGNGRSNLDYDSDDEPLMYDSDDEPLMYSRYETADEGEDDDDAPLMKSNIELKKADFALLKREMTRKGRQQRAKFIMDKYGFKIKGWYNMKKDEILIAVENALKN